GSSASSYAFFFYRAPTRWYLHSFPTRRSSDLAYWRLGETSGATAFDQTSNHRDATLHGGVTLLQQNAIIADYTDFAMKLDGSTGDRKSTRLNSSHLGISYAVFCLKKKKKHNNK